MSSSISLGYSPSNGATGAKAQLPFYVTAYGAKGDGVTDDTTAIIDCATAAGTGGHVYFPPGRYKITGNLITGLPAQQTWEGSGYQLGVGNPANIAEITMASLTGTQVGITAGTNQVFRNLLFRGPSKTGNTAVGISSTNHVQFDWCQFYSFYHAQELSGAFYTRFNNCEWAFCGVGAYFSDACFNVTFTSPVFRLWDTGAGTGGIGIQTTSTARNIRVLGGSIEGFGSSGGIKLAGGGVLTVLGTYWESSLTGSSAIGIEGSIADNQVVTLLGCEVYLTELNRWVNLSGRDKSVLVSHGNHFVCADTSTSNPTAYVLPTNGTSGTVDVSGDSWADVALSGASYVGAALNLGAVVNVHVVAPAGYSNFAKDYEYLGRAIAMPKRTAAPTTPQAGIIAVADNATWDPLSRSGTDPYPVFYDGAHWCPMGVRTLIGTAAYDPPSLADGAGTTTTVTVTNAALGDRASATFSLDTQGITITAWVSAADTVSVRFQNESGGVVDLASGTLKAIVEKF